MVQLALKVLLLISLGQYFALGDERKRQGLQLDTRTWPNCLLCPQWCPPWCPPRWPKLAKDKETFYQPRQLSLDEKRKIFNEFDADSNGCLTYEECKKLRPEIPEQKARTIFAKTDTNNDKCIDFYEFSKLVDASFPDM